MTDRTLGIARKRKVAQMIAGNDATEEGKAKAPCLACDKKLQIAENEESEQRIWRRGGGTVIRPVILNQKREPLLRLRGLGPLGLWPGSRKTYMEMVNWGNSQYGQIVAGISKARKFQQIRMNPSQTWLGPDKEFGRTASKNERAQSTVGRELLRRGRAGAKTLFRQLSMHRKSTVKIFGNFMHVFRMKIGDRETAPMSPWKKPYRITDEKRERPVDDAFFSDILRVLPSFPLLHKKVALQNFKNPIHFFRRDCILVKTCVIGRLPTQKARAQMEGENRVGKWQDENNSCCIFHINVCVREDAEALSREPFIHNVDGTLKSSHAIASHKS
ncbi:hypothetical protein CLF_100429 [Clonorchis sinensis]|uniref:Uncharacterized protein n=1 Tax=Clonorchis sinensis TaxID=79923 RepID=G7Y3F5_CLOSI|nr:hypothetical protein CLF_100429 [Clonorchis sinensis]